MNLPQLKIGNIIADIPVVQGGMGVRVSLSSLAAAVANAGGIGTISSIGLGDVKASEQDYERISREALVREIRKAKSMTDGHLAINIMGVLSNADDLVRTAIREGIHMVVYGAGLPIKLPELAGNADVSLVPIISSARVAALIMRAWDKRYNRTVDGFILEGPLAGGHLGFSLDQLDDMEKYSLDTILPEVVDMVKPYEQKFNRQIPVIAAGGIYNGQDIARMFSLGAAGVQMGTRFVCTDECGVSSEFKQAYIDSTEADIVIVKSPVGMPGRAIRNPFLDRVEGSEKQRIKCRYRCLTACKVATAKYCIAEALVKSYEGDVDNGLIFCGQNAHRIDKILPVKELMDELVAGVKSALIPELKAA